MIKFGDLPIEYCDFSNIKISCYEPTTCETIVHNNRIMTDTEALYEYKLCTKEETDKNYSKNEKQSNTMFIIKLIILIECIIIVIIIILFILRCIKKRSDLRRQKSYYYLEDNFPIENIENYHLRNNNTSFYSNNERINNSNTDNNDSTRVSSNTNRNTMVHLSDMIQDIYPDESATSQSYSVF